MRTPSHDEELVAGFLLAEGFIESRDDLDEIRRVRGTKGAPEPNVIDALPPAPRLYPVTCRRCGTRARKVSRARTRIGYALNNRAAG